MIKSFKKPNQSWSAPKLSLVATALFAMSNTVIAQEEVEEIIVSGEKIDRTIQDTVSSVAALTQAQIEESAIYDIQDIFDRLANVNSANANEGFTIRGINDSQVGATGTSNLASYHVDGAFISRRGIQFGQKELWDVSQVEVFRGPQSTNQGRNSLAGAVFVRSNDPTYEPEGQYRVAFGSDNTRALSFAYGEALIEDQLAFRFSIDDQATDGYITNEFLDDDEYGDSSNTTIRGKLLFEPAAIDGLSILTTLSFSDNESGDDFSSLVDDNGDEIDPFSNRVFADRLGIENVEQSIATTEINYELNDRWSLTSITSWNRTRYERFNDSTPQVNDGDAFFDRQETTETLSQEFRFNFTSDRLRANGGLYYFDQDTEEQIGDTLGEDSRAGIITAVTPRLTTALGSANADIAASAIADLYDDPFLISRDGSDDQSIENYAVFGNIEYDISDFVTVFAGARYDSEDVTNQRQETRDLVSNLPDVSDLVLPGALAGLSSTVAGLTIPGVNNVITGLTELDDLDNSASYSAFLPKAGLTLNWADNLSTSFTVQRAYRAGGSGTNTFGNFEFDPEFTTNFDFALRSQWFDNKLTVNANLFYVDWEDQQVSIIDPQDTSSTDRITVNASDSTVKGAELEIGLRATSTLDLYTTIGYVDAEFDNFPVEALTGNGDLDLSGNEFNNAPEITASAGFSLAVLDSLQVQADINYQDESFDNPENTSENDSRTVVNSKITYKYNDAVEIALVARNLFDEEYIVRGDVDNDNVVVTGQPRTVLLQLQGKF